MVRSVANHPAGPSMMIDLLTVCLYVFQTTLGRLQKNTGFQDNCYKLKGSHGLSLYKIISNSCLVMLVSERLGSSRTARRTSLSSSQTSPAADDTSPIGKLKRGVLPSAEYCRPASFITHYFQWFITFWDGTEYPQYFQFKRLVFKTMLLEQGYTAGAVAEKLGYQYATVQSHL